MTIPAQPYTTADLRYMAEGAVATDRRLASTLLSILTHLDNLERKVSALEAGTRAHSAEHADLPQACSLCGSVPATACTICGRPYCDRCRIAGARHDE